MRFPTIAGIALGALSASCACPRPQQPPGASPVTVAESRTETRALGAAPRVAREYLVTVAPGLGEAAVRDVYGRLGVARIRPVAPDLFLVDFAEDPGLDRLEELRRGDGRIRAVQPNLLYRAR